VRGSQWIHWWGKRQWDEEGGRLWEGQIKNGLRIQEVKGTKVRGARNTGGGEDSNRVGERVGAAGAAAMLAVYLISLEWSVRDWRLAVTTSVMHSRTCVYASVHLHPS
jgi:hypothetical protein